MDAPLHRVYMIGWEYPPHNSGGLGIACQGITEALAEQNTQIYFTLPYVHPLSVSHMQIVDCPTSDLQKRLDRPPFSAYAPSLNQLSFAPATEPIELETLPQSELEYRVSEYSDKVLKNGQRLADYYSVIHAHDWMSFPGAMKLQHETHKPFVAHVHSTEFDRIPSGNGSQYIAHTEYSGLQAADKVIAVSHFTKRMLVEKYAVDPAKIEVVHNGVFPVSDVETFDFAQQRQVIVFMGRLTAQKGGEYFLDLANQVLKRLPSALFVVAGSGDQYHYLLLKNAGQQLSASVLFTGFLRDRQREVLLNRADVFVMPSVSEPFGLVALEAAQRHTPVIVSHNSGVKEIMPNAIPVDFWDIQKMSDAIVNLIQNPEYRQQVVAGQNKDLESATWSNAAQKIKNVYQQLT